MLRAIKVAVTLAVTLLSTTVLVTQSWINLLAILCAYTLTILIHLVQTATHASILAKLRLYLLASRTANTHTVLVDVLAVVVVAYVIV